MHFGMSAWLKTISNSSVRVELALASCLCTTAMKQRRDGFICDLVASHLKPSPGEGRNRRLSAGALHQSLSACESHSAARSVAGVREIVVLRSFPGQLECHSEAVLLGCSTGRAVFFWTVGRIAATQSLNTWQWAKPIRYDPGYRRPLSRDWHVGPDSWNIRIRSATCGTHTWLYSCESYAWRPVPVIFFWRPGFSRTHRGPVPMMHVDAHAWRAVRVTMSVSYHRQFERYGMFDKAPDPLWMSAR